MSSRLPLYSASSLAAIALLLVVRTIGSRTLGEMKMAERVEEMDRTEKYVHILSIR